MDVQEEHGYNTGSMKLLNHVMGFPNDIVQFICIGFDLPLPVAKASTDKSRS